MLFTMPFTMPFTMFATFVYNLLLCLDLHFEPQFLVLTISVAVFEKGNSEQLVTGYDAGFRM